MKVAHLELYSNFRLSESKTESLNSLLARKAASDITSCTRGQDYHADGLKLIVG